MTDHAESRWYKVAEPDELPDGRVKTVQAGHRSLALTRVGDDYGALDNTCPHQGGPLGEGSIEKGMLRCPWHGYDYDPLTGTPPPGFSDAPACFPLEVREDGVYVEIAVEPPHERTVSDVMVETMVEWGVTHVFGMVGHSNLGFADAMRRQEVTGNLRFIGIRHEGAAAFAASAYAKLTGRPAACFGIAGPGSTNLLTGLYDAKVDRAPVLALSGQVPSKVLGRGAFQDLDLNAAFADVAGFSRTVLPDSDHAELMSLALKHAILERQVAHLVLPDEVQVRPAPDVPASRPQGRVPDLDIAPPAAALADAAALIGSSQRPVFVVGHGARFDMPSRSSSWPRRSGAPVLTTFKAKGVISDRHPLGAGVLGRSGTPVASWLMNESDLLVVFGASFSNHTGIASYKPIIQVDYDPMALGRFHPVTVPVLGHVGVTAAALTDDRGRHVPRHRRDVGRPAARRGRALGDLAGGEGPSVARRRRPRRQLGRDLRRAHPPRRRRRGHRGRRRQQHLLVRSLLRVRRPVRADVGLPRARSASASRRPWERGPPPRSARSWPSPATAASASTWPRSPPR